MMDRAETERAERMAELESRVSSPRLGVRPWLSLSCAVGALFLMWLFRWEMVYFFSPGDPISLGREGQYRTQDIVPNRYVQVHGAPVSRAAFGFERSGSFVVVGFADSPFLVRRRPWPGEQWRPGKNAPQHRRTPFEVEGRLISRRQAGKYEESFSMLEKSPGLRPREGELFLIEEGVRPGQNWVLPLGYLLGFIFLAFNLWLFARAVRAKA